MNNYICVRDNFKLLEQAKKMLTYYNSYIRILFNKNKYFIRDKVDNIINNIFEETVRANVNVGNIRTKSQKELITKTSELDYYVKYMYDVKVIPERKMNSMLRMLKEYTAILYGWMNESRSV